MRCPGRFGGRSVVHIGRRRGISKAVAVHYSLLVGSLVVPLLADKYIVKDEGLYVSYNKDLQKLRNDKKNHTFVHLCLS